MNLAKRARAAFRLAISAAVAFVCAHNSAMAGVEGFAKLIRLSPSVFKSVVKDQIDTRVWLVQQYKLATRLRLYVNPITSKIQHRLMCSNGVVETVSLGLPNPGQQQPLSSGSGHLRAEEVQCLLRCSASTFIHNLKKYFTPSCLHQVLAFHK